ncbi:conserved hypothetical protein [Leishmania major strain Friedlin]|uniref:Uncharacterized protein n=1 Tax=Leishmania major TaxID=5664 RepID=Q9NFA7_LEIMA|nr:conserved hypothetical protein [Leishmania major strain Friedlin]CAC22692.1 conserved hypothetical protein [Leishmania major strain Friedlin]CAG9567700.1 hypothetical_protein_-_conserved [Leishmania major strain Friedlin]|eukprot:XP_888565.1 conserved hypothetical protein [Leishmania major strain Friedlin]
MRGGARHAAAVTAALPCSQSASHSMVSSPHSATVTTSGGVFGGNSPATASPSSGCRQQRLSRGSLSEACPSPTPSVSYTSQQQQQRSQRQMKKGRHHHRVGGGRREAQRRRLPASSASDAAMSKPKVPPPSFPGRRSSSSGSSGGDDIAAGMCTVEDIVKSAVDPQAQFTMSSNASHTTTITTDDDDGNEPDSSCSPLPRQQQQQQRPPDQSRRTKGNRDSKPRIARGWANTRRWENLPQKQRKQRRHLQSRQDRHRIAAKSSEASVEAGATAHNVANEEDAVAGNMQGSAAAPEEEEVTVSCKPRNGRGFASPPATTAGAAAEETLENEELLPAAATRQVPGRSAKNAMATPSRRPAVTEGGGRSRHRRRLSPAHPVASSPAVSRDSSINDAVGDAAVDEETQPLPRLSHAGHDGKTAVPAGGPRRPLRAGNKESRRQKQMSTAVPQPQSGPGVATGMAPVTAVAAFSTRPPPLLCVPQDPIIVARQVCHTTHTVVAESALPDPPPTVMRLAAFSSAKGSITDPCVVAAVLPMAAGAAAHAVGPAVPHGGRVKGTAAPSTAGPPTVVSSRSMPPPPSEEDQQLSRRGLRFGAAPFYPAATVSLILAMAPDADSNGGDASLPSLAAAVPSPQSLLGSYSMSPARSPPLVHQTSSPLGDSRQNHSRSSTGGPMSRQSTFVAELAAATDTPWTSTVIAPSHASPPSSIGRDDTDGDGPSSGTPSVPVKSPAHGAATAASYSSNTEMQNVVGDRPSMRRSALMVTNTATGACVSPATVTTPSGSPTALWSGSGGNGPPMRTSGHTSGASSITAPAATTSPGGAGHHSATHSGSTPQGVVVREFPQAPYPVVNRTTELHQSQQQHSMRSPRLMSESDLDCVQHNRVPVSDVVAKDEGTLVDTLFADVNMIEDDESEVDGDDLLSSRGGGERWTMQPAPSPVASSNGSPLVASSPVVRTPHSMNQQLQHRSGSFSAGVRMLGKEAGGQVFGGGYWYPSGLWASTDATGRGSGSGGTGTGSYRGGGGDVKTTLAAAVTASIGSGSGAAAWRGLSTPPHRHRGFSASCASVASTMSLIDPKQPQAEGAAYDMMGEDDEWEMNSSAYADSLDEAQIQWIEEQLRATENPAGYF